MKDCRQRTRYVATWLLWMAVLLVTLGTGQSAIRIGVFPEDAARVETAIERLVEESAVTADTFQTKLLSRPASALEFDRIEEATTMMSESDVTCALGAYDATLVAASHKAKLLYASMSLWTGYGGDHHVNLLPSPAHIVQPIIEVLLSFGWTRFAVITHETLDHHVIRTVIEGCKAHMKFWTIYKDGGTPLREMLMDMRSQDMNHFLLLTVADDTRSVLQEARHLGMLAIPSQWMIPVLGTQDIISDKIAELHTNISILSLGKNLSTSGFPIEDNVLRDALGAIYAAVRNKPGAINESYSFQRQALVNNILKVRIEGETGPVTFDYDGRRHRYSVYIYIHNGTNIAKVGRWRSDPKETKKQFNMKSLFFEKDQRTPISLKGTTINVVTMIEPPFMMLKEDHLRYEGNVQYEGFLVDLIEEIAAILEFRYHIYLSPDGKFGELTENGTWNGLIGEIVSGNAKVSLGPLSINTDREMAVDFTKPYMIRSVSVLIQAPELKAGYFQFMNALSTHVWLCILAAFAIMTALLFVLERYGSVSTKRLKRLGGGESIWFMFGSLVGGSTETTTSTVSSRVLTSAWWFFALILTSTYTANLAAFLTIKKVEVPISTISDLLGQHSYQYGTVRNSGIANFVKNTKMEIVRNMWTYMTVVNPDAMVDSSQDGLERVRQGNYAFLYDSTVISYHVTRDCGFIEIGPPIDPKGLGLAVADGAPYKEDLSLAILKLSDNGRIPEIKQKWWPTTHCADSSPVAGGESSAPELAVENVAGLFIVLGFATAIALLAGLLDISMSALHRCVVKHRKKAKQHNEIQSTL